MSTALRTCPPELLADAKGSVILRWWAENVQESGHWEPRVSIPWESSR